MASPITSLLIVYTTVYSGADQRKHQSSASLAFVRGIHRRPVNSPHKGPVTRKMFPFDDVIMRNICKQHDDLGRLAYITNIPPPYDVNWVGSTEKILDLFTLYSVPNMSITTTIEDLDAAMGLWWTLMDITLICYSVHTVLFLGINPVWSLFSE